MRGVIGRRINKPSHFVLTNATKQTAFSFSSDSSGSGRGRGRGVPAGSSPFDRFTPSKPLGQPAAESKPDSPPPSGGGHGRGQLSDPSSPVIPSFSSFLSSVKSGTGRGRVSFVGDTNEPPPPNAQPPTPRTFTPTDSQAPTPRTFNQTQTESVANSTQPRRDAQPPKPPTVTQNESDTNSTQPSGPNLPSRIISVLPGAGRGKTSLTQLQRLEQLQQQHEQQQGPAKQFTEENRHIRAQPQRQPANEKGPAAETGPAEPKMSREDAVKLAIKVLSRGDEGGGEGEGISSGGPGMGMGRGRGRGRGRGKGRGRGEGRMRRWEEDDDDVDTGLYLGDNADGEKLAEKIGAEKMNMLVEGFEELSSRVLPSPIDDAHVNAFDTNCKIEFEPEYLMEEFGTNPDIDEKPPIPLRDALEKMKPFLMAYEGIQSHEEWEEAVNEVMERVPLLKEIVDHYSGPDRVTAKQQGEELERVAKTIPESAPASAKRFANRAVLSLQSNPGWGFDKKCQFMDKLAWEFSQQYK